MPTEHAAPADPVPAASARPGPTGLLARFALWVALAAMTGPAAQADGLDGAVALCTSCHGAEGMPADPGIPIIWGQEFYYLYVQLKDYKAGRRANPVMGGVVAGFERDQLRALAQHFADKPWPATGYSTPESAGKRAQAGLVAGQCVQCHLGGFEGNSRVPRLAGQRVQYLKQTLLDFKNRVRLNSPAKNSLLSDYTDADIEAMAQYLAGL